MPASEKALDHAFADRLRTDPQFARWLLSKTRFSDADPTPVLCRSDHPWGAVPVTRFDENGVGTQVNVEGETDVLVVFSRPDGTRMALHVENKVSGGSFRPGQPELYAARAEHWKGNPKYGNYAEWQTLLIAPRSFFARNAAGAAVFGVSITHEELAEHIPEFR